MKRKAIKGKRGQTPSQTVGPFFAYALTPEQYGYAYRSSHGPVLWNENLAGERIRITGRVFDGAGKPIEDAMIEIWQADAAGRYADARRSDGFRGLGRCGTGTDPQRRFWFDTVRPGALEPGAAPFINVIVLMRGMLVHAYTRLYFPDAAAANAVDPVLATVPAARRRTLVAIRDRRAGGASYRFDIRMQGPRETVFFDV
ncbi:MAG TPA: protocatechuate 3,4-dioxygenase subunit alpha [Burkholderiales bacterium]